MLGWTLTLATSTLSGASVRIGCTQGAGTRIYTRPGHNRVVHRLRRTCEECRVPMRPMAEDIVIAGCMFWAASLASWVVPRIRRRESEWTRFRRQMLGSPMR